MKVKEFFRNEKIYRSDDYINNPIVSIIMPTYCRGDGGLLERAIDTVINQTFKEWELIVVDDGSSDKTREIIQRYMNGDNRIVYIRNEINSGIPAIRANQGILYARGRYIAYQFDDDQWYEDMLEIMYNKIKDKKNISLVYGRCKVVNVENLTEGIIGSPYKFETIQLGNYIPNNTVLYSKEIPYIYGGLECHLGCTRFNDWDCWRRWANYIDIEFINKIVSKVEICNKDAVGMIYNENRKIVTLLNSQDRVNKLKMNNIGECEIDNIDFIQDKDLRYEFIEQTILPWYEKQLLKCIRSI